MVGHRKGLVVVLVATTVACVRPADERADRDFDEVGRADTGDLSVHVDPGHVVSFADGQLVVRVSAPVATLELAGSGSVNVRVENVLAAATVTGPGAADVVAPSPLVRTMRVTAPASMRIAPPDVDEHRVIRFAFVSDFQVNADAGESIVREINADPQVEMVLCTGDIIDKGSDAEQWAVMEPVLSQLRVPLYATTGNHELNGDGGVQYHARLGRMNYTFDYHGTRFALADSGSGTLAKRVFDHLDETLAADGAALRVFMTHIPLLDSSGIRNGGFSSRLEAQRVLAMLARNDVDLTLYGHVHSFEAFSNARIPAFISGGGGGNDNAFDGIGNHFLLVTMDPLNRRAEAVVRMTRPE